MSISRSIILIGFMGTGKSALGRILAASLQGCFIDTDAEIERTSGRSIKEIFALEGEEAFRGSETWLLQTLAAQQETGRPARLVIATGGGMPLREENVQLLRKLGFVVWLTASAEHILQRVGPDLSARPLLAADPNDPQSRITELLAARAAHYASAADLVWDTSFYPTCQEAAASLMKHLCQLD